MVFAFAKTNAQYHDAKWVLCFGQANYQTNVILDFNNGQNPQVQLTNSIAPMLIENASISDEHGNLLFFTNGIHIYDKNLNLVPGGNLVLPYDTVGSYVGLAQRQGCMFLPWPGDTNKYILLHTTKELPLPFGIPGWIAYHMPTHLNLTVLNKNLNNGNGGIVAINQIILHDTLANPGGGLAVTKHANGRDWWIIVKKHYRNKFYKYLLTPSGIQNMGFQNAGLDFQPRLGDYYTFSPNGEILGGVIGNHRIALFNFDRCSGLLSNYQSVDNPNTNQYWCEDIDFSPNSTKLYTNELAKVFQYDLTNINTPGAVQSTQTIIADTSWTTLMCDSPGYSTKNLLTYAALASDGRIYYASNISCPELTFIEYPDSMGLISAFNYAGINIINNNASAMPYFPNYRLGPVVGSVCDSLLGVINLKPYEVMLYPNPAKDKINITSQRELHHVTISLISLQGQLIQQQYTNSGAAFELNLPLHIANGIYFLALHCDEGWVVKKVVVRE